MTYTCRYCNTQGFSKDNLYKQHIRKTNCNNKHQERRQTQKRHQPNQKHQDDQTPMSPEDLSLKNLDQSIIQEQETIIKKAIINYENYHKLPSNSVTVKQVEKSSCGIIGWYMFENQADVKIPIAAQIPIATVSESQLQQMWINKIDQISDLDDLD